MCRVLRGLDHTQQPFTLHTMVHARWRYGCPPNLRIVSFLLLVLLSWRVRVHRATPPKCLYCASGLQVCASSLADQSEIVVINEPHALCALLIPCMRGGNGCGGS